MKPLRQQVERYLAETDWDKWQSLPDEFDDANIESMVKAARKMKAKGYDIEDIADITGLTTKEIETL